jgi:putative transposase
MIKYKAEEVGLSVNTKITEEYTSQTCAFCKPMPLKEYANKSNRIHRGLYYCRDCGTLVNADVNGAINISKEYLKVLQVQSVVAFVFVQWTTVHSAEPEARHFNGDVVHKAGQTTQCL